MGDPQFLRLDNSDGVLTVTLDRPKANAFNDDMVDELLSALADAARDERVRAVLLTGAGRFFSAGQDVTAFSGDRSFREHLHRNFNRVVKRMHGLEKPIVGAINGPAVGAGLGIALATDLRIAGESASFIYGFTGIGLSADSATSLMLTQLAGLARAMEMALTNRPVGSEEALGWGLVNRTVPDDQLLEAAGELAATLAKGATAAYGLSKRAMQRASIRTLQETLEFEAQLQEIAGRTADHSEGKAAFLEKREPNFTGS